MSGQQIGGVLQELFSTSIGASQAALLTSYSWRRVASTLADTCRSSVEQVNHFGGWAGVYGRTDARQLKKSMAHRYCGRRAELEWQAKCEHWHLFRTFMDGAVYSTRAGGPTAHQVTWEMLAQAAATPVPDDGPIRLDSARQEAVTFAAACVAQGYREFLYGASEELRPRRFRLTSPATPLITDAPERSDQASMGRPVAAPPSPPVLTLIDTMNGFKWVTALAGRVTHVRTCDGPPPEILCRHKRGQGHRHLMSAYSTFDGWVDAAGATRPCCGTCWNELPPAVRAFFWEHAPQFAPAPYV